MMKELGTTHYRFSISWARILPNGVSNNVNQKGIDYYNNLIDALVENNITPLVTLYHWDLPQYLQNVGGWINPKIVKYFTDYVDVVFKNFGDRVKLWATFNEPGQTCRAGYGDTQKAPVLNQKSIADYLCAHNLIKSHASVYHLYNNKYRAEQNGKYRQSF